MLYSPFRNATPTLLGPERARAREGEQEVCPWRPKTENSYSYRRKLYQKRRQGKLKGVQKSELKSRIVISY